jgi:hypothetical protein
VSSWTGAHEIFQAREYDAGASKRASAEQKAAGQVPAQILKLP